MLWGLRGKRERGREGRRERGREGGSKVIITKFVKEYLHQSNKL